MKKICSNCFYRDKKFNEYPCLPCITDGNRMNWADVKQQMIVEELEKIKEKIDIECDSVDSALDVILDRIAELKGEKMITNKEEIFDEYWEFNKEAFAELACRKLYQLGMVKSKDGEWIYKGDNK